MKPLNLVCSLFSEKEEKIAKEKEQGTYKEKVSVCLCLLASPLRVV